MSHMVIAQSHSPTYSYGNTYLSNNRLAPSLEWSRGPIESRASGETGKLYMESHSGVSILVTVVIAAVIGHSIFFITITWTLSHL